MKRDGPQASPGDRARQAGVSVSWPTSAAVVVLIVAAWATSAWGAVPLDREDQLIFKKLERLAPDAARHYLDAERLADAGREDDAIVLLRRVSEMETTVSLALRRQCELLTAAGRRSEALEACAEAVRRRSMPKEMLARVRAILSAAQLSPKELADVETLARLAVMRGGADPWGYAAKCEVASRLDELAMLRECTAELERRAPGHFETERAKALMASKAEPLWVALAWLGIAAMCTGTLAHALLASRSHSRRRRIALGAPAVLVVWASLGYAHAAHAEAPAAPRFDVGAVEPERAPAVDGRYFHGLSAYAVDTEEPWTSVPTPLERDRDPIQYGYLIMDLGDLADQALHRNDHRSAVKFFLALAKAAPENAVAFSRLCAEYEVLGERARGIESCTQAVARPDAKVGDYARLSRLVLNKEGMLDAQDLALLDDVVAHLTSALPKATLPHEVQCQVGVKNHDQRRLEKCTTALAALAPNSPQLASFGWALALERRRLGDAHAAIERARVLRLDPSLIERMRRATAAIEPWWWKPWKDGWLAPVVAVTASLALLLLVMPRAIGHLRSRPGNRPLSPSSTRLV